MDSEGINEPDELPRINESEHANIEKSSHFLYEKLIELEADLGTALDDPACLDSSSNCPCLEDATCLEDPDGCPCLEATSIDLGTYLL